MDFWTVRHEPRPGQPHSSWMMCDRNNCSNGGWDDRSAMMSSFVRAAFWNDIWTDETAECLFCYLAS